MKKETRKEFYAFTVSERTPAVIRFSRHFSKYAAEAHYGDLSKRYRGSSYSDYHLALYEGKEELEADFSADLYEIDFKAKTITRKKAE